LERVSYPGKPLVEPETGIISKYDPNKEYYDAVNRMRKIAGDNLID